MLYVDYNKGEAIKAKDAQLVEFGKELDLVLARSKVLVQQGLGWGLNGCRVTRGDLRL